MWLSLLISATTLLIAAITLTVTSLLYLSSICQTYDPLAKRGNSSNKTADEQATKLV